MITINDYINSQDRRKRSNNNTFKSALKNLRHYSFLLDNIFHEMKNADTVTKLADAAHRYKKLVQYKAMQMHQIINRQ
jgi:hypothetical protein